MATESLTDTKTSEQKHSTDAALENYYKSLSNHFAGSTFDKEAEILASRLRQINDEVRLLENSINFFENVAQCNEDNVPEIKHFKKRLYEAKRVKLAIGLAIQADFEEE